jgi:hypothetical protein
MNLNQSDKQPAPMTLKRSTLSSIFALFTSSGTLICCALPALLVSIGAGAAMSSLVTNIPQLLWFSEHKVLVFILAGCMLIVSGVMQWRAKSAPCPANLTLAGECMRTRKWSFRVYLFSIIIFTIGGFFAFIAPILLS